MPVYRLSDHDIVFPPPSQAPPDGLLAVAGDLRPERLLAAYSQGIFPWPHDGYPLLWFSPDPRMVLRPAELHVARRLARTLRQGKFEVRLDSAFRAVMEGCAGVPRKHERGTWITPEMIAAYCRLHELGFAHSAEAYSGGELVGGIYGVSLGHAFIGESMFARVNDASKVAFATLVHQLARWEFTLVDAQVYTRHVAHFGATEWPRARYLRALNEALQWPTRRGRWVLEEGDFSEPAG